jgi:hypothetical protein
MGAFDSNPSSLEEKLEMMKLKNQLLDEKVNMSQKKAIIKEIKRKYGKDWKSVLKLGKDSDMLKQFANAGRKMGDVGAPTLARPSRAPVPSGGFNTQSGRPRTSTPNSLIEGSRKSLGLE